MKVEGKKSVVTERERERWVDGAEMFLFQCLTFFKKRKTAW